MGVVGGGIGAKLMSKMGWVEGQGLGAKSDGIKKPVTHRRKKRRLYGNSADARANSDSKNTAGLGADSNKNALSDNWWEVLMKEAYGAPQEGQPKDLFAACGRRRCRPHGKAKLARLDKHDRVVANVGAAEKDEVSDSESESESESESIGKGLRTTREKEQVADAEPSNRPDAAEGSGCDQPGKKRDDEDDARQKRKKGKKKKKQKKKIKKGDE